MCSDKLLEKYFRWLLKSKLISSKRKKYFSLDYPLKLNYLYYKESWCHCETLH